MDQKRNYGIDLLRLVLMFMVCLLHMLGQGGVLTASPRGSAAYNAFWFLEVCAYCAVDGFALISGYVASTRMPKWHKLVSMWFQVVFYSFGLTAICRLLHIGTDVGTLMLLKSLIPVTSNFFWYFTAYFALFFAMPVLNAFIERLDMDAARKTMVILVGLFCVIGLVLDSFYTQYGYSALWLMVLYLLGALARKVNLFSRVKSAILIAMFFFLTTLSWGVMMIFDVGRLVNYVSPTILVNALILVILFSRIKMKGTVVKRLSPLAFGIYLFQMNPIVWNDVLRERMLFALNKPIHAGIVYVLVSAVLLFIAGLAVEALRSQLAKMLRIQWLSQKIVNIAQGILSKVILLLR